MKHKPVERSVNLGHTHDAHVCADGVPQDDLRALKAVAACDGRVIDWKIDAEPVVLPFALVIYVLAHPMKGIGVDSRGNAAPQRLLRPRVEKRDKDELTWPTGHTR